jgi:hypothetical protein
VIRHVVGWTAPVLALVVLFGLQLGSQALGFSVGVLLVLLFGIVVGAVAEVHGRMHPGYAPTADQLSFTLWILPGLIVWAAGLAIVFWQPDDIVLGRGLPLLGALLVGLAVFAQDREIARASDLSEPAALPRQLLSLLTYLTALGLFTLIYQVKERDLVSASSTAICAALLSLALLRGAGAPRRRTILYAALVGLSLGEVTWALNYWVVKELVGGAVLLLFYYVVVGLIEIVLRGELSRRLLTEYVAVGIVGFLFILSTAPWRP